MNIKMGFAAHCIASSKTPSGADNGAAACGEASRLNPNSVSIPTHPRHDNNSHRQIVQFTDAETGTHDLADDQAFNITMTDDGRFNISTFTGDSNVLLDLARATDHPRLHAVITEDVK